MITEKELEEMEKRIREGVIPRYHAARFYSIDIPKLINYINHLENKNDEMKSIVEDLKCKLDNNVVIQNEYYNKVEIDGFKEEVELLIKEW